MTPPASFTLAETIKWTPDEVHRKPSQLRDAANLSELLGASPQEHLWRGVGLAATLLQSDIAPGNCTHWEAKVIKNVGGQIITRLTRRVAATVRSAFQRVTSE